MFCRDDIARLASHSMRALGVVREFLLLEDNYVEDNYDVDWGLDHDKPSAFGPGRREPAWEEPDCLEADRRDGSLEKDDARFDIAAVQRGSGCNEHPHRAMLRRGTRVRRPGTVAPQEAVCLCPVGRRVQAGDKIDAAQPVDDRR